MSCHKTLITRFISQGKASQLAADLMGIKKKVVLSTLWNLTQQDEIKLKKDKFWEIWLSDSLPMLGPICRELKVCFLVPVPKLTFFL